MDPLNPGLISAYNSLTDKHLTGYFNNTRIRKHLQRVGMITRSGRIVPEKEHRHRLMQRAHQRHVRECLAQAIFHKVLEMERLHQIEIKRKLEDFARRERVHKIKVECSKRYEEDFIHILSPRPPTGPRGVPTQHSGEGENSESTESPGSSRPNTAPGKMQRPVRLKPINSTSTTASHRGKTPYRERQLSTEMEPPFNYTMDRGDPKRHLINTDFSQGISPYCLPVVNNFVTPVPPTTKRKDRGSKVTPIGTLRGRRLRSTTAPSGTYNTEESIVLRSSMRQSGVQVNMVFFGKTVHLSHDLLDLRDEVKVFQQHCGGENLCVYKGRLREGETFQFVSRRHRGFPFSLTFFLNGLQVERLSSCCEFKHRKRSRLGGRHGHFGFCGVEGASPCYKCIIAMGLVKKPTPPPKRVKDKAVREVTVRSPSAIPNDAAELEKEQAGKDDIPNSDPGANQGEAMETEVKDITQPEEERPRDDYEEDFEAEEEMPGTDSKSKDMKSPSPSSDKEQQDKERYASHSEDDDRHEDRRSHSASSSSDSDRATEDEEEEEDEGPKEDQTVESRDSEEDTPEVIQEETPIQQAEKDKVAEEEDTRASEVRSAASPPPPATTTPTTAKDSETQDSAGDSTELDVPETSAPSGNEGGEGSDTSGAKTEDDKSENQVDECPQVEEVVERAKSVQEKLAEAILLEVQCNSEPELSDTTTEEEEESTVKGHQQNIQDAAPLELETSMMQQHSHVEESADKAREVVEDPGEVISEHKKDEDEPQAEPIDVASDKAEENYVEVKKTASETDEKGDVVEKEKSAEKEDMVEEDHSDGKEDAVEEEKSDVKEGTDTTAQLPSEEKMADEEPAEPKAVETDQEKESVEVKVTEEGSEGGRKDELSSSELKSNEMAVPDNAEVETVTVKVGEAAEIKAELSTELEAISCEEPPSTDKEEKPGNKEAVVESSETEVTAENSRSSSAGSGDTTVHAEKTDVSAIQLDDEQVEGDENTKEAVKEDLDGDASKNEYVKQSVDGGQMDNGGGDDVEENVEIDKKCEGDVGDRETNQGETTEVGDLDDNENSGKTEEMEEDKTQAEEQQKEGEDMKTDENAEANAKEEPLGGNHDEGAEQKKVEEAEKSQEDTEDIHSEDGGESSKNKADEEESEEQITTTEKSADGNGSSEDIDKQAEKTGEQKTQSEAVETSNENAANSEDPDFLKAADATNGTTPEEKAVDPRDNMLESEGVQGECEKGSSSSTKSGVDAEIVEAEAAAEAKQKITVEGNEATQEKKDVEGVDMDENTEECIEDDNDKIDTGEGSKDHEVRGDKCDNVKVDEVSTTGILGNKYKTEEASKEYRQNRDGKQTEQDCDKSDDNNSESKNEDEDKVEDKEADIDTKSKSHQEESALEVIREAESEDKLHTESKETKQDTDTNKDSDSDHKQKDTNEEMVLDIGDGYKEKSEGGNLEMSFNNQHVQNNVREVIIVSSVYHTQSEFDSSVSKLEQEKVESLTRSDSKTGKLSDADNNAAGVDPSALNKENALDTGGGSKPSEEDQSAVFKPQPHSPHGYPGDYEVQGRGSGGENYDLRDTNATENHAVTPEVLEKEDNRDLVTNWVKLHQASNFFEKFVQPLDEWKEWPSDGNTTVSDTRGIETTKERTLSRSGSPLKMSAQEGEDGIVAGMSKTEVERLLERDGNTSEHGIKVKPMLSDPRGNHSDNCESEPTKDKGELKETTEGTITLITKTEHSTRESSKDDTSSEKHEEINGSFEGERDRDALTKVNIEHTENLKTEIESIAGTHDSGAKVRPDLSTNRDPPKQEAIKFRPQLHEEHSTVVDIFPSPESEELAQSYLKMLFKSSPADREYEDTKETVENKTGESTEVTQVKDLLTSNKSDDDDEGDTQNGQVQSKSPDRSIGRESTEAHLIEDLKHTLSKDQLGTFSVEESSHFGRSSYPLFTAARTESGY